MKLTKVNFVISWVVLSLLFIPAFALNALGTASNDFYSNWQLESDVLAVAKFDASKYGVDSWDYGLLVAQPNQMAPLNLESPPTLWDGKSSQDYVPYQSQLGLQGHFFLTIFKLGITSFEKLQAINAIIFSFVFAFFVLVIARASNLLFASLVVASTIFSPWMVAASHSVFWVSWSWFLPAIFAFYFVTSKTSINKAIYALLLVLSFVFRFGSGYEFVTSFVLLAAGLPILMFFFNHKDLVVSAKNAIANCFKIIGLALTAFVITLVAHASLRGDGDIPLGIMNIIKQDVLRRTYGDPGVWANPEIQASLVASPVSVIKKYLFDWNTDFLVAGSQSPFTWVFGPHAPWFLLSVSIAITLFQFISKNWNFRLSMFLLCWGASIPFSWYLMAKSHSYIHTQINFVLWYLLFAAILLYIPISMLVEYVRLKFKQPQLQ